MVRDSPVNSSLLVLGAGFGVVKPSMWEELGSWVAAGLPSVLWWPVVLVGRLAFAVCEHDPISTGLLHGRVPKTIQLGA